jgi:enoyl-CoA hydratase
MGAFRLLSGDYRIGATGHFKIVTNEVAIGLTMPSTAIVVAKQRLTPAHFVRAIMQSEEYNPDLAVEAGFLDRVVSPEDLKHEALEVANRLAKLDFKAYYKTKMRTRRHLIKALKRANRFDPYDIIIQGIQRILK